MAHAGAVEPERIRLAELVAALSLGIDLGFGQPMEHVLRQCIIALRAGGARRPRRGRTGGRLLHRAARERRVSLRRPRAGQVVRRRHRAEVGEVRPRVREPAGRRGDAWAWSGAGTRRCTAFRVGLEFALSGHRDLDGMIEQHAALARGARRAARTCRTRCRTRSAPRTSSGTARAGRGSSGRRGADRGADRAARRVRRGRAPDRRRRRGRPCWPTSAPARSSIPTLPAAARAPMRRRHPRRPRRGRRRGTRSSRGAGARRAPHPRRSSTRAAWRSPTSST